MADIPSASPFPSPRPSKPLEIEDTSAFEFVKELLAGEPTYAINFDRIQWDAVKNCYLIIEFLLCDEKQFAKCITPFTSHPNRYFKKNAQKFLSLWRLTQQLAAKLYLVNYAKAGTRYADEVLFMEVLSVDENNPEKPVSTRERQYTRAGFAKMFRELNRRGQYV